MAHEVKGGSKLDEVCINTIRCLAADVVQKATCGHPGMPMGMAPVAHVLWSKFMHFNPSNPKWVNRDRFVLSNGHGCVLLYIMLHLNGYALSMDDLKRFRQLNSITPGHPENVETPGVEVTTGPLGQGVANGVGMAIAQAHLASEFNRPAFPLLDSRIWIFCGDGCMEEGISHEAASLAGHLKLGNLFLLYDDNGITIDGKTGLSFSEDIPKRFEAYGWHTQVVHDGNHDLSAIEAAIREAMKVPDKPHLIAVKTIIGFGSKMQDTAEVHGAALGPEDVAHVKKTFGFDPEKFFLVPDEVTQHYAANKAKGAERESKWNEMFAAYKQKYPNEAAEFERRFSGKLPANWTAGLPTYKPTDKADATRNLSHQVLNVLAKNIPELMGGSADLTGSNKTALKNTTGFSATNHGGRYLYFGVREHAMIAAGNGMRAFGGVIPFTATFLNFIEYGFPAVRLAAISHFQQILIMTHDSIGLGEDGPTHQPVEALTVCRACPFVNTLRPADGNEVVGAYIVAIEYQRGPTVLSLSRQNLPHLAGTSAEGVKKGAYVVLDVEDGKVTPDLILVGSGSEVHICVNAASQLNSNFVKTRVVSMPSWELFDVQPAAYRRSVFIPGVPVISVETAAITGWERYSHASIGMVTFGASAPEKDVYNRYGFTADKVVARSLTYLNDMKEQARQMGTEFGPTKAPLLPTHFDLPVKPF